MLILGNNKSVDELRSALEVGLGRIVVDSVEEIDRLVVLAREYGVRPRVLVRVTVGIEAHTHEFIATAHEDQKFGFSLVGGAAAEAVAAVVYEVGTVKPVELDGGAVRHYVSVDGGMSDNVRTALYDADYTSVLASRNSSAPAVLCRVVGKHCETGDVVVRQAWLPGDVVPGDLVAVAATGAYCRSMASTYNDLRRPPVVAVDDSGRRPRLLLRRETVDDLLALDVGAQVYMGGLGPDESHVGGRA